MTLPSHLYTLLLSTSPRTKLNTLASSRPRLTLLLVLLLLPFLGWLVSYPVHKGDPIGTFAGGTGWYGIADGEGELEEGGGGVGDHWWGVGESSSPLHALAGGDLNKCEKTMLYTFSGPWGFASEYMIFLRAALFAKEEGYTVLLDSDRDWTYVNILEYLLPNTIDCVPHPDWRTRERHPVGDEGWEKQNHIRTSRGNGMWEIESHMRSKFKHESLLQDGEEDEDASHHHHEQSDLLPADMTLMPAYREVFRELSTVVRGLWRPSEIIRLQVADLSKQHRLRERMSIGVHIRMGDKASEQAGDVEREGGDSGFRQGNLTAFIVAAQEMLPLLPPLLPQPSDPRSLRSYIPRSLGGRQPPPPPPQLKPLLLIMSDSPHVALEMKSGKLMDHEFEIAQLPDPPNTPEGGHDQGHFNEMGWRERLETTEGFVRDLTIVSQVTDGFIGTASSNVGRLISLLCGPEKVINQMVTRTLDIPFYYTVDFEKWT